MNRLWRIIFYASILFSLLLCAATLAVCWRATYRSELWCVRISGPHSKLGETFWEGGARTVITDPQSWDYIVFCPKGSGILTTRMSVRIGDPTNVPRFHHENLDGVATRWDMKVDTDAAGSLLLIPDDSGPSLAGFRYRRNWVRVGFTETTAGPMRQYPAFPNWLPFESRANDHRVAMRVPLWAPFLVGLFLPVIAATSQWKKRRRRASGRCPVCNYDLRATPNRCPECGAVPGVKR